MDAADTTHGKLAEEFASALVVGDFERAHRMLATSIKDKWSAGALKKQYDKMTEYFESPASTVLAVEVLDTWPDKQRGDVGWVYAAIVGEAESEAVTVVVCEERERLAIRSVEWGRP